MILQEFLELAKDCDVTVYSFNQPIYHWFGDNDPRYQCGVLGFGIASETELWVNIDEVEH